MSAAKKSHLDDRAERVYLTLLAHADVNGLTAQCSWTDIMDYAGIVKPEDAKNIIKELTDKNLVRQEIGSLRKPIFRLFGKFTDDILEARGFQAKNQERVNTLRNNRTSAYKQTKDGRSGNQIPQVFAEDFEHLPAKETNKPDIWRFTMRVPGFGTIKNCVYIAFTHKQPEISGPSWRTRIREDGTAQWIYPVDFEPEIYQKAFTAVTEAIEVLKEIII